MSFLSDVTKAKLGNGGNNYTNRNGGESGTGNTTAHDPDTGYGFTMGANEPNREDDMELIDADWAKSRFMTPNNFLTDVDAYNRFHTQASYKFVGTRIGEHIIMNPKPQFTRYADIKPLRRVHNNKVTIAPSTASLGLGRYYSETIDDYKQVVFLEFGVPEFNSLLTFFLRSIDYEDAYVAKYGAPPHWYAAADGVATVARWILLPGVSALFLAGKAMMQVFGLITQNTFSYYYMRPTMHTYWGVAGSILNMMATELGILNPMFMDNGEEKNEFDKEIGVKIGIDDSDIGILKYMLPGIINTATNQIDLYAVATKAQKIASQAMDEEAERIKKFLEKNKTKESQFNSGNDPSKIKTNVLKDLANEVVGIEEDGAKWEVDKEKAAEYLPSFAPIKSYGEMVKSVYNASNLKKLLDDKDKPAEPKEKTEFKPSPGNTAKPEKEEVFKRTDKGVYDISPTKTEAEQSWFQSFVDASVSTMVDGARWVPFHVDYVGEGSESFSSSTSEIETEGIIKQIGSQANTLRYNFAGGNIAAFTGDVVRVANQVAAGALNGATFGISGVIAGLLGGGFIDLPKKWDDSSFQLPNVTYKISLRSPYGNPWSQLQDIYVPLALLIAGAAPLAVGKASYSSPFLCSAFCRGVQNVRLGMITELSITRGTGNLGFDRDWRPLGIDVQFTITDFSSIAAAPISSSFFGGGYAELGDDTPFGRYIAMMCGRDLATNAFYWNRFKMKLSRAIANFSTNLTPEAMAVKFTKGTGLSGLMGMVMRNGNTKGSVMGESPI